MADKKVIFVAFAIEDVSIRDLIKGQSLNTNSPFEYIDMSVQEPYDEEWKKKVRTRILRSDGVLAIIARTHSSHPAKSGRFSAQRTRRGSYGEFGDIKTTGLMSKV